MADDKAWRNKQAAAFHREQAEERRKVQNRDEDRIKLAENFARKLMTTGVGALAAFEAAFGYLWGQDGETLTENQKQFRVLYQQVRDEVFDLINQQSRGMQAEISLHSIEFIGHKVKFNMKSQYEKGNEK